MLQCHLQVIFLRTSSEHSLGGTCGLKLTHTSMDFMLHVSVPSVVPFLINTASGTCGFLSPSSVTSFIKVAMLNRSLDEAIHFHHHAFHSGTDLTSREQNELRSSLP